MLGMCVFGFTGLTCEDSEKAVPRCFPRQEGCREDAGSLGVAPGAQPAVLVVPGGCVFVVLSLGPGVGARSQLGPEFRA